VKFRGPVRSSVLPNSARKPGPDRTCKHYFRVEIIWPSGSHCGYCVCNSQVQPLSEFDHYGFQIRVPGVRDEVSEVVEVVVDCPSALEIANPFQLVGCHGFRVEREKLGSEVGAEVVPVDEVVGSIICGGRFPAVDSVSPFLGLALVHESHGPADLRLFIRKIIRAEVEVCLAGIDKASAFLSVFIEVRGRGGLQIVFCFSHGSGQKRCGRGCRRRVLLCKQPQGAVQCLKHLCVLGLFIGQSSLNFGQPNSGIIGSQIHFIGRGGGEFRWSNR